MKSQKTIFLLIGPKGSGKSFIGSLFKKHFDIKFIRVEKWMKEIKGDRSADDKDYVREAFELIENNITKELKLVNTLVFESTGLSEYFDKMLINLKSKFNVVLVKISASPEACLQRVKTREQSLHINISDDLVMQINRAVEEKNIPCEFYLDNNSKTERQLTGEIKEIISSHIFT